MNLPNQTNGSEGESRRLTLGQVVTVMTSWMIIIGVIGLVASNRGVRLAEFIVILFFYLPGLLAFSLIPSFFCHPIFGKYPPLIYRIFYALLFLQILIVLLF